MDDGWGSIISALAGRFGWGWVLSIGVLVGFVYQLDFFKRIFSDRSKNRNVEREQNWDDAQDLIRNLREEVDRLRLLHIADTKQIADGLNNLVELRRQLGTALDTIASEQRGNSRLRHALNNLLQAYGGMRDLYRKAGLDPPPFNELKGLLELGYDKSDLWMFN